MSYILSPILPGDTKAVACWTCAQVDRDLLHFKQDVQLLQLAEAHWAQRGTPLENKEERGVILQRCDNGLHYMSLHHLVHLKIGSSRFVALLPAWDGSRGLTKVLMCSLLDIADQCLDQEVGEFKSSIQDTVDDVEVRTGRM